MTGHGTNCSAAVLNLAAAKHCKCQCQPNGVGLCGRGERVRGRGAWPRKWRSGGESMGVCKWRTAVLATLYPTCQVMEGLTHSFASINVMKCEHRCGGPIQGRVYRKNSVQSPAQRQKGQQPTAASLEPQYPTPRKEQFQRSARIPIRTCSAQHPNHPEV